MGSFNKKEKGACYNCAFSICDYVESDLASFVLWSVLTAIVMGITGFSYKSYSRRIKNEITSS